VLCQEAHPERYDVGGARVLKPDVAGLLPVFVLDRYEGYEVKLLQDCSSAELERWVEANAEAVRAELPAEVVFCNHVLLGGAVGKAAEGPHVVKAHGSELEYSMRGRPKLEAWGREVLELAHAVFVGSAHIREVLEEVCGHVERVYEVPPGVDVDEFAPQTRADALSDLIDEALRDAPNPENANERLPDDGNAHRFEAFFADESPVIVYFGKLIENKGVQLLLEALRGLPARALIVGFGDYRSELEARARELPPPQTMFTGPLEHRHLVHLLPLAEVAVVPSIFPEAFGMVAAEAAAAGCPPLVARHSGLAEVAEGLSAEYPEELRSLTSFTTGDAADLRARLIQLLALSSEERESIGMAARRAAVERWSWATVAERLLALSV